MEQHQIKSCVREILCIFFVSKNIDGSTGEKEESNFCINIDFRLQGFSTED